MSAPRPWWEDLADSWDRIADQIEKPPQNGRADVRAQKLSHLDPKSVAATARALATGLRIAGPPPRIRMSDFEDMIAAGFAEVSAQLGKPLIFEGRTALVVPGSQAEMRELRNSGVWETGMQTVELTAADLARLGIVDRSKVEFAGSRFKVMVIDRDPADPCVRLTLHPDHAK